MVSRVWKITKTLLVINRFFREKPDTGLSACNNPAWVISRMRVEPLNGFFASVNFIRHTQSKNSGSRASHYQTLAHG